MFVAHAEVVAQLRPLQVQVDQEHGCVDILRESEREVDRGQALTLTGHRAGDAEREPVVRRQPVQNPCAQNFVRPGDADVRDPEQYAVSLHRLRIDRCRPVLHRNEVFRQRRRAHHPHGMEAFGDLAGGIRGSVIDHDDLERDTPLFDQRLEARLKTRLFIACRDNDRHDRPLVAATDTFAECHQKARPTNGVGGRPQLRLPPSLEAG